MAGNQGSASTSSPAAAGRRTASGPAGESGDGAPTGQGEGSRKGFSSSQAHEPGGAGAGLAAPRRIRSYPLWEGEGVNPNPNPITCSTDDQPRLSNRASELGSAEVAHADAARQGASGCDPGSAIENGGAQANPVAAYGDAGGSPPHSPVPWDMAAWGQSPQGGESLMRGGHALLGSPAPGPFSELQRSADENEQPERVLELCTTGPAQHPDPGPFRGSAAAGGEDTAAASAGLGLGHTRPQGGNDGACGGAGFPAVEGLGSLKVYGAEAHSRRQQDYYAATVAVDVLSFLYVAVNYQVRNMRIPGLAALCHSQLVMNRHVQRPSRLCISQ